jgi:hypothetical protein
MRSWGIEAIANIARHRAVVTRITHAGEARPMPLQKQKPASQPAFLSIGTAC